MMNTPVFLWLITLPLIAAPLVYLSGHLGKRLGQSRVAWQTALAALVLAWVPFVLTASDLQQQGPASFTMGSITLTMDGLGLLLAAVALALGTLVVLYSGPYMGREAGQEKYYAMLLVMIGVMIGLGTSGDLFNLWIWFEAMAVSSYVLVAFYREQPTSLEAGLCWWSWELPWCFRRPVRWTWPRFGP